MAMTRTVRFLNLLVLFLTGFLLTPRPTQAIGVGERSLSNFAGFNISVQNGEADVVRGVYVQNVLALPVVQQPADKPYHVSNHNGEVTQFSVAAQYGNVGLLAHNTLSGSLFSQIAPGQEVRLVYGDGRVEYFEVAQILRFQALEPKSTSSSFRNLDEDETLSSGEMFNRAYAGERHLVFQTCITGEGNVSWGRLFVLAVPKK